MFGWSLLLSCPSFLALSRSHPRCVGEIPLTCSDDRLLVAAEEAGRRSLLPSSRGCGLPVSPGHSRPAAVAYFGTLAAMTWQRGDRGMAPPTVPDFRQSDLGGVLGPMLVGNVGIQDAVSTHGLFRLAMQAVITMQQAVRYTVSHSASTLQSRSRGNRRGTR